MSDPQPAPVDRQLATPDYVLGVLTLPLLLFVLMFATSGMTEMLAKPGPRRRFLLSLLAAEVVVTALVVALVVA